LFLKIHLTRQLQISLETIHKKALRLLCDLGWEEFFLNLDII